MWRMGLSLVAAALVLSACGGDDAVDVVVSAPVSTQPWIAKSIENGAKLAVADANARGGVKIAGKQRKLKVEVLDNASSPANALADAKTAVGKHAAALLTDGTGAISMAPVTDRAKLPTFVLFEGGTDLIDPQAHPSLFRLAPGDEFMTRRVADYIANAKPKVAMLTDDSAYGQQGRKALRTALGIDQIRIVSDQTIPANAGDVSPQIVRAKGSGASKLIVWASAADVAATLEAVRRAGWNVQVISGQTGEDPLVRQRLATHPEDLRALRFVSGRITAEQGPAPFNAFRRHYEAKLGIDKVGVKQGGKDVIQPPDWPMYSYDAVNLVLEAIRDAGGLGAPELQTINDHATITGANGDQRGYNATYHEGVSPSDMYFARFDGFVFVPVKDDPLSGTLPAVNQLGP
jgi:ABC-type branched-subunit amino acid transport system substrate-binding protein